MSLRSLRLDRELGRRGYRRYAADPGATAASLVTNVCFGCLIAYILLVLDERADVVGGYDMRDVRRSYARAGDHLP